MASDGLTSSLAYSKFGNNSKNIHLFRNCALEGKVTGSFLLDEIVEEPIRNGFY
jgi:hypothetical protein